MQVRTDGSFRSSGSWVLQRWLKSGREKLALLLLHVGAGFITLFDLQCLSSTWISVAMAAVTGRQRRPGRWHSGVMTSAPSATCWPRAPHHLGNLRRQSCVSRVGYASLYPFCEARLGHAYAMDGRHKKPAVLVEEALTLAPGVSHRNAVTAECHRSLHSRWAAPRRACYCRQSTRTDPQRRRKRIRSSRPIYSG